VLPRLSLVADKRMSTREQWRNDTGRGKACHSATLSTTNSTRTGMGSNPGHRGKMLGNNRFNNGADIRTHPYQYRDHSTDLQHVHFRKPYCHTQLQILSTHTRRNHRTDKNSNIILHQLQLRNNATHYLSST